MISFRYPTPCLNWTWLLSLHLLWELWRYAVKNTILTQFQCFSRIFTQFQLNFSVFDAVSSWFSRTFQAICQALLQAVFTWSVLNGVLTFQHVSMPQAQFDHSVVLCVLIDCTIVITLILLHIYNTQNWGLVTYREVDLLIDEKTVSDSLLLIF